MQNTIRARILRIVTYHGRPSGDTFEPSPRDELEARREDGSEHRALLCLRGDIEEINFPDHAPVHVTAEDDDSDVSFCGVALGERIVERGVVEVLVEHEFGGHQEWYPATRVWPADPT